MTIAGQAWVSVRLTEHPTRNLCPIPGSWSQPTGRRTAASSSTTTPPSRRSLKVFPSDVFAIDMARNRKVIPLLNTPFYEYNAVFSPDGKMAGLPVQ